MASAPVHLTFPINLRGTSVLLAAERRAVGVMRITFIRVTRLGSRVCGTGQGPSAYSNITRSYWHYADRVIWSHNVDTYLSYALHDIPKNFVLFCR